jgi:hypothetical protein
MNSIKKHIFLIDGIGALTSTLTLALILPMLNTGLPKTTLLTLSVITFFFSIYSLTCFIKKPIRKNLFLKIIYTANLMYCVATACIILYYFKNLTILGIAYFMIESFLIVSLCAFEKRIFST